MVKEYEQTKFSKLHQLMWSQKFCSRELTEALSGHLALLERIP